MKHMKSKNHSEKEIYYSEVIKCTKNGEEIEIIVGVLTVDDTEKPVDKNSNKVKKYKVTAGIDSLKYYKAKAFTKRPLIGDDYVDLIKDLKKSLRERGYIINE